MNAIREIVKPINHKRTIELPNDCSKETEYEVIIFTNDVKKRNKRKVFCPCR